jgi:hypothetical protein
MNSLNQETLDTALHGSMTETTERKKYNKQKMNEPKIIKLTGHFNKTFSVKKEEKGYKGLEYSIEWDFDKEQTRIPISTHGATKLADTFRKLGFTQIHPKGYNKFI